MFVPLWILIPAALLLLFLLVWALRGSRGDMIERQRRATGDLPLRHAPRPGEPDPMTDPQVRNAIESGRKVEAVKLVRERYDLGLKEAKNLVDRQSGL